MFQKACVLLLLGLVLVSAESREAEKKQAEEKKELEQQAEEKQELAERREEATVEKKEEEEAAAQAVAAKRAEEEREKAKEEAEAREDPSGQGVVGMRIVAKEAIAHGFLDPSDGTAISFWIISISMVAATVFFLMEALVVSSHWKTSVHVGSLVTLVAAVHYFYMREFWIQIHSSPILYRYIDWSITVPLQMIEFNLILKAVQPDISAGMFWRLLVGTVAMLTFGYCGESSIIGAWVGFVLGLCGWFYILYEIFVGEAGQVAVSGEGVNQHVQASFNTMRFIVTVGWSIYPLGYFLGYLTGAVAEAPLNCVYNLADLVNKIGFCLAIWSCAKASTEEIRDQMKAAAASGNFAKAQKIQQEAGLSGSRV